MGVSVGECEDVEDAMGSGEVVGEPARIARSELAIDAVERDPRTLR